MKFPRRRFLRLAASAAALPALLRIARAQGYPTRPVRIVVGFPSGGTNDARLIAEWLTKHFGRSFIVENRAGAAGNIGAEAVVRVASLDHLAPSHVEHNPPSRNRSPASSRNV